jgi:uncharacterized membrane protein YeaQ/YmgE (transglycosylase-associated protein family)
VAVKVIGDNGLSNPEVYNRLRARFRREAGSAASLPHHPNVVPVYDFGTDATLGFDYIVMELLRGEDLAQHLQRSGPPPLETALRILAQAACGVAQGHGMGLVHRDIKPANLFLVNGPRPHDLQVRVLDFGIAKAIAEAIAEENTQTLLTHNGYAPLSPAFASPEQLRRELRLTFASDVFSLGIVGWKLLTGTQPFTEADLDNISRGMDVPLPSLRARNAIVPPEVENIIRKSLTFTPAARFPSAVELSDALELALRRVSRSASPVFVSEELNQRDAVGDRAILADRVDGTAFAKASDRAMTEPLAVPAAARIGGAQRMPALRAPRPMVRREPTGVLPILWLMLLMGGVAAAVFWAATNAYLLPSTVVIGLIAGALAKLIMPGRDPGGIIVTILLGIAGALVGGFLFGGSDGRVGLIGSVVGALILLFLYRLIVGRRARV